MTRANRGQVVAVRMEPVARRDLVAVVTASGQIEAKSDVDVSSDVQARINKIHVKEGDYVHKGELLVELDQSQFKGAVDRGKAGLLQVQALQAQAAGQPGPGQARPRPRTRAEEGRTRT